VRVWHWSTGAWPPDIDALAALDGFQELELVATLVQIGWGMKEQPSEELMVSEPSRPIMKMPRAARPAHASTLSSKWMSPAIG
jgi:hypothetical protein